MPTQLIVNADDFGARSSINAAVREARRAGVLTSASLMVEGEALREAVSIAEDDPGLAVGLHLTLSREKSSLPPEVIPDLVDYRSRFRSNPAAAWLRYLMPGDIRRQLRLEIEAQFEIFAETELPLSHVDGHQHLHAHPAVLPTVIECATRYGARGIRIPRDPFWTNMLVDRSHLPSKLLLALGVAHQTQVCRRLLRNSSLARCDYSIGSLMSGRMTDRYVMGMLQRLNASSIEVYFHPANVPEDHGPLEPMGPNGSDLRALMSPDLKRLIDESGYQLTNYAGLRCREAAVDRR